MDSDVNALDDLLSSLEQINADAMAGMGPPPQPPPMHQRDTALGEKKGVGVKVVTGEPNLFGVRLRKVNANELSPSAKAHASIAGAPGCACSSASRSSRGVQERRRSPRRCRRMRPRRPSSLRRPRPLRRSRRGMSLRRRRSTLRARRRRPRSAAQTAPMTLIAT